ncbi:MAG: hypothetical protein HBSAPP03_23000 [Phycisphaerae bacterium]|nr:MAG: hypothetical protein HBSAPP03_23000 [Phycisphaerae bacterium]
MARNTLIVVITAAMALGALAQTREPQPVKVFILAGQSNMAGHAVVDLTGKDYNDGKGTLVAILNDPDKATTYRHLRDEAGHWRTRDDVLVRFRPEHGPLRVGPLSVGFTTHEGRHHFGPELQFGHAVGDAIDHPVLLIKTAWGGKSLYEDFRPPSSGGTPGPYYTKMIAEVREAIAEFRHDFPDSNARGVELAGFVWYHGWNDGCDPQRAVPEYEANLVNLIRDVRTDLGVPNLPVVIGELTGPWVQAPGSWDTLRKAQAAAASRPEFRGSVVFVPTNDFVRPRDDSPNPTHEHHEFGNAETCLLVGEALGRAMLGLMTPATETNAPPPTITRGEMSGYMLVPVERAPKEFNAGFSLYAAAWPLLDHYPGARFQTGLFGTWMFAQYDNDKPKDLYSDIEGGLGWWRDTRFATSTPKFIMGGVALNFSMWANGPGAGKGRDWSRPLGKYGVAQLSPWVLWPPDGLNLAQGTCGELLGYGYLPLPLINPKPTTAGKDVPTGGQCWTLFLNSANFKGPVAFFTPYFWSEAAAERPELAGLLLDTRPSEPNKAFQMETQWVPAIISTHHAGDNDNRTFARTAPMAFPIDDAGRTVVLHKLTVYAPNALTEPVRQWFAGGATATGAIDPAASFIQSFGRGGGSTWRIFPDATPDPDRREIDWRAFGTPIAHNPETFGYQWDASLVRPVADGAGRRVRLPEYFRLAATAGKPARWVAMPADEVPASSGLREARFEPPQAPDPGAYVTPDAPQSPFRTPGYVAGPFEATLGDGSVVTYAWYRFADQPAMLNADLTPAQREEAQRRAELLHRTWTKDRTYLAPPSTGSLASLDPALIVTPPPGLDAGYVPIVLGQERRSPAP